MPDSLADKGLVDQAASISLSWSEFIDPETLLSKRALLLAKAGRKEAALQQIRAIIGRFAQDTWVRMRAGDAYRKLDQAGAAEAEYRKALELAGESVERLDVLERLILLLRETGKTDEAAALEAD